jgi:hypothetical protein
VGVVVVCKGESLKMKNLSGYFELHVSAYRAVDLIKKAGAYPGRGPQNRTQRKDIHTCEKLVKW